MDTQNRQTELLRYIGFHQNSESHCVNSIHGIVSTSNILSDIVEVLTILRRDYSVLFYSGKSTDTKQFIHKLIDDLRHEKVVVIAADTLDFDPVIYDQLIEYRDANRCTVALAGQKNLQYPPKSKIFLYYNAKPNDNKIYEFSNHVLNCRETQS